MIDAPTSLSQIESETLPGDLAIRKQALSEKVAGDILALFRISVISMTVLTIGLAALDAVFIAIGYIEPGERLVTESVLMSVIGATIVQVGAASLAIVYALFRKSEGLAEG